MDTGRGRGRAIGMIEELAGLLEWENWDIAGSEKRRLDLISASVFGRASIPNSFIVGRTT